MPKALGLLANCLRAKAMAFSVMETLISAGENVSTSLIVRLPIALLSMY